MAQNKQTAYHGTSDAAAANIRKEQHFRESEKDNEWLGRGVYFFAHRVLAQRWIKGKGDVLTATLEYDDRELHPEIGVTSYTFSRDNPIGLSRFSSNARQICVSNHRIITSIV